MGSSVLTDRNISELFCFLAGEDSYVLLDTSKPDELNNQSLLFLEPMEHLQLYSGGDRQDFISRITSWLDRGFYIAGWFGYEFLHDRQPAAAGDRKLLLADLGVYGPPRLFDHDRGEGDFPFSGGDKQGDTPYRLENLRANMVEEEYCRAIRDILEYIAAGDTYQVNYTFKMFFDFEGSVSTFYRDLRRSQPVPYSCCIKKGDRYVLSFSPELFFRAEQDRIIARPMKGTVKRGRTNSEDSRYASFLQGDVKNRSENVMIVDLLRNDLSRLVANTGGGTVRVSSLFDVERYRTVFQMTSTIVAERRMKRGVSPDEILDALFPCGSVTGAPKIRTMEIIDELEKEPRGVYTGAVGYFSPEGRAVFNVPIRTVVLDGKQGEMGIGSGIVSDSSPEAEWQECLLKARFLTNPVPRFELIETMLYQPGKGWLFLQQHLDRLTDSASYFNFVCDRPAVEKYLETRTGTYSGDDCRRVRLTLSRDGELGIAETICAPPKHLTIPAGTESQNQMVTIGIADERVDTEVPWFFHKTTHREIYDRNHRLACEQGLFDLVFLNHRGEVTEGCISNIIVSRNGQYSTPALSCGLLAGVMREVLLKSGQGTDIEERILYREDVLNADQLFVCNSVRGVLPARLAV